jgi:hypothetical protein
MGPRRIIPQKIKPLEKYKEKNEYIVMKSPHKGEENLSSSEGTISEK